MPGLPTPSPSSTALVTGASAGIGTEIARELARRGHGVTLVARRRDRLEQLAAELAAEHGVRAEALPCDLTDPEERAKLPDRVAELGLTVDVLVNNAGFGTAGPFHRSDVEREVQQVRVLVEAVVDLTGRFVPGMVERGSGAILTIASTAGFQPLPRMAGYGAAKAWARSFSAAIHEELKPKGIAVTAVCPGPVETEFFDVSGPTPIEAFVPKMAWVQPDEVARAGLDALARNRSEIVPGRMMSTAMNASRMVPREAAMPVLGRFFKQRRTAEQQEATNRPHEADPERAAREAETTGGRAGAANE